MIMFLALYILQNKIEKGERKKKCSKSSKQGCKKAGLLYTLF